MLIIVIILKIFICSYFLSFYRDWISVLKLRIKTYLERVGQQHDEESGLYYNRHRYYNPLQGRYITQDPIGLDGGLNAYVYVYNNPVGFTDSMGLAANQQCTIDPVTGQPVGRFISDSRGNIMMEPVGDYWPLSTLQTQ